MAAIGFAVAGAAIAGGVAGTAATTVFTIGTFAVTAGFIGSTIGGLAGSFIDSKFLFPALFGAGNSGITGPRIDDLHVQTASEGSEMKFVMGPKNRFAGTIIWCTDLIEVPVPVGSGGGKGGGGDSTGYEYYVDIAIGICEGPIYQVLKIWGNDKLIYDSNIQQWHDIPAVALTGQIEAHGPDNSLRCGFAQNFNGFVAGQRIHIAGYLTATGNNGTATVVSVSGRTMVISGITLTQYPDGTSTGPYDTVTVSGEAYRYLTPDPHYEHISFFKGTTTQPVSSLIESYLGAGNVPAYRDTAYVVLKRLKLSGDFGGVLPTFTFEVAAQQTKTVASGISQILTRAGRDPGDYDVSRVPGCLLGFISSGPTEPAKSLEPLLLAYNILVQENNGVLTFFARGDEPVTQVDNLDLAATDPGSAIDQPFKMSDVSDFSLPTRINVLYADPELDYQQGGQSFTRIDSPSEDATVDVSLPMTFTSSQAQSLARMLMWQAWTERQSVSISLPPKYSTLLEGEVVQVTLGTQSYKIRIEQLNRGANFVMQVSGPIVEIETADTGADSIDPTTNPGPGNGGTDPGGTGPINPPDLTFVILDIPAIRDSNVVSPGFYWAIAATDPTAQWTGAQVLSSINDTDFNPAFSAPSEHTMGVCRSVLGTGPVGYWDYRATVDVELIQGELVSSTEDAVLQGDNWAAIGNEIVGFVNAVLIGTRKYRLSGLLRGRRCTHGAISTHAPGETFVRLSLVSTPFFAISSGDIGGTSFYRAVPSNGLIGNYTSVSPTLTGATLKQFNPVDIAGTRDGSNNLTITWNRRTRSMTRLFSAGDGPLLSDTEAYEIDIYDSTNTVVRTITVTAATTAAYSAADQTTDGLTPGDPVVLIMYQMNSVVGRGFPSDRMSI